jgi:A/G-specific adenine glycosylase
MAGTGTLDAVPRQRPRYALPSAVVPGRARHPGAPARHVPVQGLPPRDPPARQPGAPVDSGDPVELRAAVLRWFAGHRRWLPGREAREPWRVLVTEVMSQQTQIERSLVRAEAFCQQYPAPESLARASTADVVRAWAGLGYNRRALALREAARAIVDRHDGRVPADLAHLVALPGIGPYTARAIAARAHGLAVMPIDVNVRRVLGRLTGTHRPAAMQALGDAIAGALPAADPPAAAHAAVSSGAPPGLRGPRDMSGGAVPSAHPGDVADALMDVAATVCRTRDPDCDACPLHPWCAWHARSEAPATEPGAIAATEPGAMTATEPGAMAALPAPGRRRAESRTPFPQTRRWLRGQLLRELRDQPAGAWASIEGKRGAHGHAAVREVLATLAGEGFVELDAHGRARLAED